MLDRAQSPLLWAVGYTPGNPFDLCSHRFPGKGGPRSGDKCPDAAWSCLVLEPVSLGGGAGGLQG